MHCSTLVTLHELLAISQRCSLNSILLSSTLLKLLISSSICFFLAKAAACRKSHRPPLTQHRLRSYLLSNPPGN